MHRGIDFEAVDGTPIYAAGSGVVAHIGAAQGFGQWIVIRHDDGASTVYGHMWDAAALGLRQGDRVHAGQHIAFVGSNGQSSGPHLHFEVHPGAWRAGSQIDPRPWLHGARNPGGDNMPGWTGDPVWLEDVLRPALGDRLKTLPGWQNSGHGDFAEIKGVMVHHTGNSRESAQSIRNGRPDLPGPLSNLHIAPDGTVTIVAVGVCWHAGRGSYPWLPTDNANQHMIGIECAWPTVTNGKYDPNERWPDAQIISMRDTCAALALKLGHPATRVIGHKEWAGTSQGKWDPGNLDMSWFRGEVAKDMRGEFDKPVQPGPVLPPDYAKETWDQLRIEWPQLGGRTLVDAVAAIGAKLGVGGCYDTKDEQ
jgi:hypothetical protein